MLLQDIADAVSKNHPEMHLMVLLIDERPEEVTEMTRCVNGEVIASSMDRDVESHVRISQLIVERGKRLDEATPGTGLGLAIARDVLELYGGRLEVERVEPHGLQVRMVVPDGPVVGDG